jgi:3-methyl-2-oxobutanoate hydroxymethyltransferase
MTNPLDILRAKKRAQKKITALTCYDYPTAVLQDQVGIDILFVGDSVGTNVLGYASETEVTMEDMIHHLKAVRRGAKQAVVLADLPYGSYPDPEKALINAQRLVHHGADLVKLEGPHLSVIRYLVTNGIPVCAHLGLLPQSQSERKMQAKTFTDARVLIETTWVLDTIGIPLLLLELIPEEVAQIISETISIPTIGIGSGRFTDGQVLIVNDILGITPFQLKLAIRYQDYQTLTRQALEHYKQDVEACYFPQEEHLRHMPDPELQVLKAWLETESRYSSKQG